MFWNRSSGAVNGKRAHNRDGLKLLYYGYATINVRGAASGRIYQFSRQRPLQKVDAEDAASILHTGLFREVR